MPKSRPVSVLLREALIECFRATTRLVRPELRRQLVLVGGVASIAQGSVFYTEDLDVAAPHDVILDLLKGVNDGALNFNSEPDGQITFDTSQGIRIRVDTIEVGESIEQIHATEPFFEGSVASVSDLLRMRAATVVERGRDGEKADFRWLLSGVAKAGQILPGLNAEELEYLRGAVHSCLSRVDRLVLFALLQEGDGDFVCSL